MDDFEISRRLFAPPLRALIFTRPYGDLGIEPIAACKSGVCVDSDESMLCDGYCGRAEVDGENVVICCASDRFYKIPLNAVCGMFHDMRPRRLT